MYLSYDIFKDGVHVFYNLKTVSITLRSTKSKKAITLSAWGTKKVDGQDDEKVKFGQLVVRPFLQLTKMTRLIWEAGAYVQTQKKGDYMNNVNRGQKLMVWTH